MKITRAPTRKLAPLPATLAAMVEHLVSDDQNQIKIWANLSDWKFPRGDMFQFIAVLNRFDTILEAICQEYELGEKSIQRKPFSEQTKQTLLAILHLSKLLFENCTNRNLYNSYEHLNHLLNTTDIDILEILLKFMLKAAQRVNNPKAVQSSFMAPQDKITELARGGSISDFMSTDLTAPSPSNKAVNAMSFYRTGEQEEEEEGLQTVTITTDPSMTDQEIFWKTVEESRIPVDYHFELLNRIRIANHAAETHVRKQLLIIRFIAIVIMTHTMSETIAQNRVFIYDPHLVSQIAQLVSYDKRVPVDIQTYALYALDGIARHRTRVTEVLSAFNASANHGILLHILRQLSQGISIYDVDFLDALFTLLSFLFQTQAGGQMLMSAGIMSTLIQIMDNTSNTSDIHVKVLIKVVGLLDTIMNNVVTSFTSFISANGLDSLLKVIQVQGDKCIERKQIDDYDSLTLVKNALRLLNRMMVSSHTAEALRNLIESSLPHTLNKVMENQKIFRPSVFSIAVHVITTFIHNEPTSLSVLQEINLPQTFLKTFNENEEANCVVLTAAVHAFGAICLNSAGLDMFNETRPLPHFFKLMTAPSFVTNPTEVGGVSVLGVAMDELIRHHPKLKGEVFFCANQLLQQVLVVGNSESGAPLDHCHRLVHQRQEKDLHNERAECLSLGHVDVVSRFLEGFLGNTDNIKEFVNYGGPELLLSYYSLPMLPYNFSVSNAFDSLSYVFRMISDVSPMPFAILIMQKVYESSRFIFDELDHGKSVVYEYIHADASDKKRLEKGNQLFRKLSVLFGYIGLLSTVFANAILTNGKNAVKLVEWAVGSNEKYGSVISLLANIHRTMVWQNILLRDSVPKAWYNTNAQPTADDPSVDLKDPAVINVRRFKLLLSEIPPALMPVLQGIIKVSVNRRPNPSSHVFALRRRAEMVAKEIAHVFKDNLLYMRDDSPICKYDYYASMFSMISMLLLDDRSRTALETPIAVAFDDLGNIDLLSKTLLSKFWTSAEEQIAQDKKSEEGSDLQRINTCIELLLAILHHLGSSKLFHNSPHTTILTTIDPDDEYNGRKLLDPYHWMASMQLKLSTLHKYLHSPLLHKFSRHVLHSLLRCVTQNMKAEGEKSRATKVQFRNTIPVIVRHDRSDRVRAALLDMGFDTQLTDSALAQFNGNPLSSLDYLFSRRLVEHAVNSGPPVLEISRQLQEFPIDLPLTNEEFDAGVRILVNMWYDQALATQALRESANLRHAALTLSRREPSAIRTPSVSASNNTAVDQSEVVTEDNDQDNDDEYEDIDSEEEEEFMEADVSTDDEEAEDPYHKKIVQDCLENLGAVRKTMLSVIPQILSRLVDERNDIDFEVRDLMVVLCCGDAENISENTKQTIHLFFGGDGSNPASPTVVKDKRALFESSINKIRIFALMLREPAMQDVMSLLITTMSEFMDWFEFLDLIVTYPDFPDPKWLTTLFLILEAGLAQSDEPKEDHAPTIDDSTTPKTNIDGPSTPAIVTPENRTTLMNYCINMLNVKALSQDNLISTLRILVRLTKHHAAAAQFVALGGLEPLFKRPSQGFEVIKIQQAYIIMILRHIIEDKSVLMGCMREWFSFWFTVRNSRFLDVATFIRNNNTMVLRDPDTFLEISTQLCRLSNYKYGNIKNIRYIGGDSQKEKQGEGIETRQHNEPTSSVTNAAENSNQYSSIVVHFLLDQLVQKQSIQEETNIKIGYTGFLLQCLLELISSYPSCKRDIIVFNSQQLSNSANTAEGQSANTGARQSILFTFINELLPFNAINPTTDQERKRQGISMWVSSLLVAMCYDTTQSSDTNAIITQDESQDTLIDVRKHVLDVVYRSFKDALHPSNTTTTSAKYIRYFALAELCHRILNARPASINPANAATQSNNKEETVLAVAKLMLEKKFVPVFISVVSDVDVNYPHAKMILNSILRPLEQLTKLAIRIDRSTPGNGEKKTDKKESEDNENEHDLYLPMDTDEENDAAAEEVSDIFRNSSLAMYDGTVLEEETSEESSEDDDVEMASSGAEIIDDDDEDDSSGSDSYETVDSSDEEEDGVEVEVEEVEDDEDEEVGEDEEMDELMRSHRFHHSDTEEDDENDNSDDGSDSDSDSGSEMSDSSSSYESSNESLNSDRSDSIHSEDSRDMAWHIDNFNDESGFMPRHQREFSHRESRQVIQADIDADTDEDDMDIDRSDSDGDQHSDDLNQEEIEDVERNLQLFAAGTSSREGGNLINPSIRGPLGNNAGGGSGSGRSFDRDNIILHPLLRSAASPSTPTSADGSFAPETAILSGTNSNHLQAYEDIIGGSAVRILENLLSQQQQRNNPSTAAENQQPQQQQSSQSEANVEESASSQENKDTLNLLQEFQPMQSADRWIQEVQMVYISSVASAKAAKLTNTLVAKLIEIAKKEEGDNAASKQQQQQQQPSGSTNEDEALATENEYMEIDDVDQVISDDGSLVGSSDDEEAIISMNAVEDENQEDETEPTSPDDLQQEERVIVTINGEDIDITGTGIDAEFLEALPDDLRAEVLSQQMAERRSSIQGIEEDAISPEFLAALPPDIREEVIRQESFERSRRQERQQAVPPNETDSTRSLPVAVNVTELNGQQMHPNLGLSGSRAALDIQPSTNTADNANTNVFRLGRSTTNDNNNNVTRKALLHKDAIRIVDRSQLAALARLLFVPQSISKALLNRLLLNLCENSKTRADLLSLLICILQDGSSDLAAVDRSFSQLSIHKLTQTTTENGNNQDKTMTDVSEQPNKLDENAPNLITQRCLEILYYVVTWNDRSLAYFLTENDSFGHLKRRQSIGRKSKNKDKATGAVKYPILILIGLLDRPAFSNNTTLMGQLMNLLATMCRPFPSIVKRYKEKLESKKANNDNNDPTTTSEKPHHAAPKPPTIPSQYLQKIVDVLSVGECTSYTFQYTLSVLSYLSSLDGALDTIIEGLISAANVSGRQIIVDLEQLHVILENYKPGTELEGSALAQFSAATSHQTKLLRVLKAMDYLYTRKRSGSAAGNNSHEENEKLVLEIYNKLEFLALWKMLGSCLSVIQDREDLINVATVLMPLVESFMAVSKYSTNKGYNATVKTNATEDFFFEFTEEHKKILNIMVRNNPSLMGGSFSLLVHNPKILEFDNKRGYFNQQLHKRTEPREHHPPLHLNVRRAHVFEDTYRQLQGFTGKEIKHGKLNVQFHNEEAADAGGVSREWFSVLARQMFDPNYALFITSAADKLTYQPNRASGVNFDHLSYFKCVGRIIGKAIHDGRLLDAYFTRSFYKLMLGRSVDYRDVEAVDPAYYKSLVWMLENDITDIIDLTFSVETDDFGTNKIIDLKPNGRNIPVTESNKHEYVSLITEQKLVLAIKEQVNAFLEGFHDIIPSQLIQIFNEQELELLISGLPDIDIDEWKANTVYEGYTLSSPQIQWFWRAVRSFDQEERAKLLQFSTGTSKVPLEGFSQLQGSNGVQKFQIHKEFGDNNRLPSAHTCFNQIDLPQYSRYEDLRSNLFKAISECSTGFAFQ